jgi:pimeloyl-ACP methyl ester carboxylesterase
MIHGLLGSIAYFEPQSRLPELEVHTPDLPGFGLEPKISGQGRPSLKDMARWLACYLEERVARPAWLLGHSVGGAIVMLAASIVPERVLGIINVEGNFTLDDAFWCRRIAHLRPEDWAVEYLLMQADPLSWLGRSGIAPTLERVVWARRILNHQSASMVQALARAVVDETGHPDYLATVKHVVDQGTPLHLLSGAKSHADWHVPVWARKAAASRSIVAETGHMLMLEAPRQFCEVVRATIAMQDLVGTSRAPPASSSAPASLKPTSPSSTRATHCS